MKKIFAILIVGLVVTGCSFGGSDTEKVVVENDDVVDVVIDDSNLSDKEEIEIDNEEISETGNDDIKVFNIKDGDIVTSPLKIEGEAVAFENNLIVELRNSDHEAMVKEFTTIRSNEMGIPGPFSITLNYVFNNTKEGYVAVYEESAKDGSERNLVEIAVKFGGDTVGDLQVYRNEEYGFEFHYNSEKYKIEKVKTQWISSDKVDAVNIVSINDNNCADGVSIISSSFNLKDELLDLDIRLTGDTVEMSLDDIKAYKKVGEINEHIPPCDDEKVNIVFEHKGQTFVIDAFKYSENTVDEVVSTFKFTK